jgi:DNA-binding NtrC family response regulator
LRIRKEKRTILVIDDDKIFAQTIKEYLMKDKVEVFTANTGAEGLAIAARGNIDLVLLDQRLPDAEGHTLCPAILKYGEQTKIIFITAHASFEGAVKAIKMGAFNYLSKPFELEELDLAIEQAFRTMELEHVEQLQRYQIDKESEEAVLVGAEGGLREVMTLVQSAASVNAPVLITGETGTGKNVVAKVIHYRSTFGHAPFVSINCAALPETLIEAELFGYEKGAFTGAVSAKKSIFEMAHGGTLFLDEIGDMPLHLQSKLLGVLDDKKIRRLGSESEKPVNVRVIAATGVDLEKVLETKFRKDLYFRLSVIRIHIPPLRERREDIPALCRYLLTKIPGGRGIVLHDSEIEQLMAYSWPGNIRELKNVLERSVIIQKGETLRPSDLLSLPSDEPQPTLFGAPEGDGNLKPLIEIEKTYIKDVLAKYGGNLTKSSKVLGISLSTLKRKIKEYGLK